jgi:eukaryotic-like serine/threonine-protein kinase
MTTQRWQDLDRLFHSALERPPDERARFLAEACGTDEAVRQKVEALVAAHEQSGEFLEAPAYEVAGSTLELKSPLVDRILSHYKILDTLGVGGMGEVYLAQDTRLGRKIALKLLPPEFTIDEERVQRFEQEARAASALSHPNVCVIHEIGDTKDGRRFITMEYIEGATLRQRLGQKRLTLFEALDVAAQVAAGLSVAHAAGIVHRDIKPENVMLRHDGLVKVLDFGLAKLTQQNTDNNAETLLRAMVKTGSGMIMGTVAYMSPEQARGLEVDSRTDIWSLGVLLYEMVAGRAPFVGATPSDMLVSILDREPPVMSSDSLEVPAELERIIRKSLRKDREERYQTAEEFLVELKGLHHDLELHVERSKQPTASNRSAVTAINREAITSGFSPLWLTRSRIGILTTLGGVLIVAGLVSALFLRKGLTPAPQTETKSLAVLPFKPIDVANRDEIYEIGIADALINQLGSTKGLVVRPLSATRRYADVGQDPLAAGKEQKVDYVLASNYQLAAGKIRITAQLLDVTSGQIEETYKSEKDAGDVFAMEDAIAAEIGSLLQARFATTSSIQTAKRGTSNEEAYLLYLQGKYLLDKEETTADAKRAIELFDKAVSLDPVYAQAWAGKARAHCAFAHWGGSSSDAEFAKAQPAIGRALALDNSLPEAYGVLGIIKADYDWNFPESERQFLRAIEIAPESDNVNRWYASRLAGQGRSEEAIARIKTAIDLNPNSLFHQIIYGRILYFARRYDDAITQLQRVIEMDSARPVAYSLLWRSYHQKDDYSRAYESFMKFQRSIRTNDEVLKNYENSYAKNGWQGVLLRYIEILKANNAKGSYAYNLSVLSALLDQREQSLRYLNDAVKNRSLDIGGINGDPGLDLLRDDPRFAELVRRVVREKKPDA